MTCGPRVVEFFDRFAVPERRVDIAGGRADALDWNRRMWTTFAADCGHPDNELPKPLRASIISLSLWVSKHTSLVIRREEEIEPLIEINRMIMQGLATGSQAAA
eukprot:gene5315-7030_t